MNIDVQTLLNEGKCFACYGASPGQMVKLALLSRILLQFSPTADVTPNALYDYGKCIACYGVSNLEILMIALLDKIQKVATGGGGGLEDCYFTTIPALTAIDAIDLTAAVSSLTFDGPHITEEFRLRSVTSIDGGDFVCITHPSMLRIIADNLATVLQININTNLLLEEIRLPTLTDVTIGLVNISFNPNLVTIDLSSLETVAAGLFAFNNCNNLPSLLLTNLITVFGNFAGNSCPLLNHLEVPVWLPTNGTLIQLFDCALDAASVNQILARCVAAGVTTCNIDLSGGTNSPPTGQGILDKAALILAGNAVNTN